MIPKCGSRISDRVMLASEMDRQRIDKWLWHARVVRTRSAAAALAAAGHVRINGQRIDASSHPVRPGDVVTVALVETSGAQGHRYAERRGSAEIARALYGDPTPPPAPPKEPSAGARDGGAGRPTKRERREIDRLQGGDEFE